MPHDVDAPSASFGTGQSFRMASASKKKPASAASSTAANENVGDGGEIINP